jgi:hypothetical protein
MADSKDSVAAAEKGLSGVLPMPFEIPPELNAPYPEREPDKVIPKKGSDGYDTPSGRALAKVGEYKGDPAEDPEGAKAHGLRYLAEKMKLRWGIGVDS